jgi:gamma-glutamylputrescine oxidase
MISSFWSTQFSARTPEILTDILIIGGGYSGFSTAFWLSEIEPDAKITVLDRLSCGSGASGRNAGFLTVGSAAFYQSLCNKWGLEKAQSVLNFASQSIQLLHECILKSNSSIGFEKTSSITLFQNEDFLKSWKKDTFNPEDFNFSWKNSQALPEPLKSFFCGGYEISSEFKINPLQLLHVMRKILEDRGVSILENNQGFELTSEGVRTSRNFIKSQKVILALNGYSAQFHSTFKDFVFPKRAQMLAARIDGGFHCPEMFYDPIEKVYWRLTNHGEILIGGKRNLDELGEVGEFEKVTPLIQNALEHYLDRLGLKYHVTHRWAGIMGFTEHELPIIDRVYSPLETYFLGGFSGHGMGFGFLSGKEMAQFCLGLKKESFFNQFKKVDFSI